MRGCPGFRGGFFLPKLTQRQNSQTRFIDFDSEDCARFYFGGGLPQGAYNQRGGIFRANVAGAKLNKTRPVPAVNRKQCAKIEVMGEDDTAVILGKFHNFRIGGICRSYSRPMDSLYAVGRKEPRPPGRKIHVD